MSGDTRSRGMKAAILSLALLASATAARMPVAPEPPTGPETAIIEFQQDGMSDYRIDGDRGIYVLAAGDGHWYYLKVLPDCPRLSSVNGFSVDTGPNGRLDRQSVIRVEGQRCMLSSVVRSPPPPGRKTLHL